MDEKLEKMSAPEEWPDAPPKSVPIIDGCPRCGMLKMERDLVYGTIFQASRMLFDALCACGKDRCQNQVPLMKVYALLSDMVRPRASKEVINCDELEEQEAAGDSLPDSCAECKWWDGDADPEEEYGLCFRHPETISKHKNEKCGDGDRK